MEFLVDEVLTLKNYDKSKKRLASSGNKTNMRNFMRFIRKWRKIKRNTGLSFEVNIENDEVRLASVEKMAIIKGKPRKKCAEKSQRSIPIEFTKHIMSLGFQESDAYVLYEDRSSWMGMHTGQFTKSYFLSVF